MQLPNDYNAVKKLVGRKVVLNNKGIDRGIESAKKPTKIIELVFTSTDLVFKIENGDTIHPHWLDLV